MLSKQPNTFEVTSSWAIYTADAITGLLIKMDRECDHDCYYCDSVNDCPNTASIPRCFDVDEWLKAYPGETLPGMSIDILDLGYWTITGYYEEPCEDWRSDFREGYYPPGEKLTYEVAETIRCEYAYESRKPCDAELKLASMIIAKVKEAICQEERDREEAS